MPIINNIIDTEVPTINPVLIFSIISPPCDLLWLLQSVIHTILYIPTVGMYNRKNKLPLMAEYFNAIKPL